MKTITSALMLIASLFMFAATASADDYSDTVSIFKNAGESGGFFKDCYAYAVFPTVGKGGLFGNTLRIKPPMCINKDDADYLVAMLDEVLTETGTQA